MTYEHLPYLHAQDFPFCEYGKAAALRTPMRDAINSARAMTPEKMEQVKMVLETALRHINQAELEAAMEETNVTPSETDDSVDPLDSLLGPAPEAGGDAG